MYDENEKQSRWIQHHQMQIAVDSALGRTTFDYSINKQIFLEMMLVDFPHYLREYLLKNPLPRLDICSIGSAMKPEFLPALREIKLAYPTLEVNTFCIDHIFQQNEACLLLLGTLARELNLPPVDPNVLPQQQANWAQYQVDFLNVYLKEFFDQNFALPQHAQNVVLTLFHTLNYLDANHVIQFLEDPRIKIICIANGQERGFRELFNRNRFTDFFDLTVALKQLGFTLDVYHEENNNRNYTTIYSR